MTPQSRSRDFEKYVTLFHSNSDAWGTTVCVVLLLFTSLISRSDTRYPFLVSIDGLQNYPAVPVPRGRSNTVPLMRLPFVSQLRLSAHRRVASWSVRALAQQRVLETRYWSRTCGETYWVIIDTCDRCQEMSDSWCFPFPMRSDAETLHKYFSPKYIFPVFIQPYRLYKIHVCLNFFKCMF